MVASSALVPAARGIGHLDSQDLAQAGVEQDANGSSSSTTSRIGGQRPRQRDPLALAAPTARAGDRRHGRQTHGELEASPTRSRADAPKPTLPSAVRCGNSAPSWKTIPIRRCSGSARPLPATSRPPIATPGVEVLEAAITRSSVVLPDRFGPSRSDQLALGDAQARAVDAQGGAESLLRRAPRRSRIGLHHHWIRFTNASDALDP